MTLAVGVLGARGRMGSEVVRAVSQTDDLAISCALDEGDNLSQLVESSTTVCVDFTNPHAVMGNIRFCVERGIHVVVGTSGLTPADFDQIRGWLASSPHTAVFVAPNFGVAAVLMMKFAELAAPYFDSVEILEMHHPQKVDAPSGTATRTAQLVSAARVAAQCGPMPDATQSSDRPARGVEVDGVPIHSVRARGLIAHQEVLFGSAGELLTLRHDSMNRESFMPGVILAIRKVATQPGLTVGLEHFLEI